MSARMTPELESRVEATVDEDLVDVVIELPINKSAVPGQSRTAQIDQLKAMFEDTSSEIVQKIRDDGGEVLGEAWINQTIRARVPRRALKNLADIVPEGTIDVPHTIESE